ncbi:hypothetical protein PENSUB_3330 [Penicillium subrubescens]|uniref:Uncharacterized protein n=1 Tax=Penicillium subrubescens TaxID=1316194 RepID=A0A1Q5UFB7_9EURO|nr:hypothetical protein PENSUB_3330 [Penicillium subrubescens]
MGSIEVLTALVDHFTTSITELMGMARPFPPTDLPEGDQQSGYGRLGHLYGPLNGRSAID